MLKRTVCMHNMAKTNINAVMTLCLTMQPIHLLIEQESLFVPGYLKFLHSYSCKENIKVTQRIYTLKHSLNVQMQTLTAVYCYDIITRASVHMMVKTKTCCLHL